MEERTRFQKIILWVLAVMIAVFGVLNVVSIFRKGVVFDDHLLRVMERTEASIYFGEVHGESVSVKVRRIDTDTAKVEYSIDGKIDDVYTVEYPLEPITTSNGYQVDGICILKNGNVFFEGGYDPDEKFLCWFDKNGEWDAGVSISFSMTGDVETAPRELTKSNVMYFVNGPEIVHRGSLLLYFLMVALTLLAMLDVAHPRALFYLRHCCDVRDPEPSDFYLATQKVAWVIYPVLLLAGYLYVWTLLP